MVHKIMGKRNVLVAGDLHGVWGPLNHIIEIKRPGIILQCGDFGWWPQFHNTHAIYSGEYEDISDEIIGDPWQRMMAKRVNKPFNQWGLNARNSKIYFCDGNHEDHPSLRHISGNTRNPCEIMNNIYYMRRGNTLTLPDGRNVLFMGGAHSIDEDAREPGIDWFPQEAITEADLHNLPDTEIDIVVSHTCPEEIFGKLSKMAGMVTRDEDPSREALSYVLRRYKPALWYFGHFHVFATGKTRGTRWFCLDMVGGLNWCIKLKEG